MAGFTPNEGERLVAQMVYRREFEDRGENLVIGLFTNPAPSEATTLSQITEPTGGGYARQVLQDSAWTLNGSEVSHAEVDFTPSGGGYSGEVQGYFIATQAPSGVPRLLHLEIDPEGPYSLAEGDVYRVALANSVE